MNENMLNEITRQLNNPRHPEYVTVLAFWTDDNVSTLERTFLFDAGTSTVTANRKTLNEIKRYFPNAVILGLITTEAAPQ